MSYVKAWLFDEVNRRRERGSSVQENDGQVAGEAIAAAFAGTRMLLVWIF